MTDRIILRKQTSTAYDVIENIINNPVCCGYLKEFCNNQFNVESLQFIMEVDAFQASLSVDKTSWVDDWRTVDSKIAMEMGVPCIDDVIEKERATPTAFIWPSRKLNKTSVKADLQAIWNSFADDSAPFEICFSSIVLQRTRYRFDHFERYGPGVFMEASIEPAKTLGSDILPRFRKTPQYQTMVEKLRYLELPVTADDLEVPPPESDYARSQSMLKDETYNFTLKDILTEPHLYRIFETFVCSIMSPEYLYCIRLIHIFEQQFGSANLQAADDTGWKIYKFFVRAGSPCQISLRAKQIRTIAYHVSTPTMHIFADLKKAAMGALTENFNAFKGTFTYQSLSEKYGRELRRLKSGSKNMKGGDANGESDSGTGGGLMCCITKDAVIGP